MACKSNSENAINNGTARRGDENGQNRAQINTKLFRPSLEVPHVDEDTPEVRGD